MKNWKRQSPSSYCFLRYDKLYIDNRLFVFDKEKGEVVAGEGGGGWEVWELIEFSNIDNFMGGEKYDLPCLLYIYLSLYSKIHITPPITCSW